jgi:arylsulfatase
MKAKAGSLVHSPAHLVDLLPTIAEITKAPLPETYPGRELSPLAGVSFAPALAGQEIKNRPPIHLLYHIDRGLRDGDWKLVSFQSDPWELYNLALDRTEMHNVASQNPEIVKRMTRQWHEMAEQVLHVPVKEREPVADTAVQPRRNPQWSDFDSSDTGTTGKGRRAKRAAKAAADQKQK